MSTQSLSSNTLWQAFSRRQKKHRFLKCDDLFSLTEQLISSIQSSIPDFFSADNLEFEQDLAATVSFGFFHQRAYGATSSDDKVAQLRRSQEIELMMSEGLQGAGRSEYEIQKYHSTNEERRKQIDARKEAYTAWLVLQQPYQRDLSELKNKCASYVKDKGRFPTLSALASVDESKENKRNALLQSKILAFYRKWGLDNLITWDWPNPMEPDFNVRLFEDAQSMEQSGITLFIPWYLLRGERLDLATFIQSSRMYHCEEHLKNWLESQSAGKKENMGDIRYRNIAWLYRYYFLALRKRYPDSLLRNVTKVDQLFGQVFNRNKESIKRLRQKIQRELALSDG
ncbi:MAG: hypothetical protein QM703_08600 [Gemmatales bacterium]